MGPTCPEQTADARISNSGIKDGVWIVSFKYGSVERESTLSHTFGLANLIERSCLVLNLMR